MKLINSIDEFRVEIVRAHGLIERDGIIRDAKTHEGYKIKFLKYYRLYETELNSVEENMCKEIIQAIDKHPRFVKMD